MLTSNANKLTTWFSDLRVLSALRQVFLSSLPSTASTKLTVASSGSFLIVPLKAFGTHLFHLSARLPPSQLSIIMSYISNDFAASTAHLIVSDLPVV